MRNNIIVISGKQYSGKDTLAKILLELMPDYKRIGIGDAIKIEYAKKQGLTVSEIEENKHLYRADLIELGNFGRNIDKLYWLKNLMGFDKIIVPDVRVADEVNYFREQGAYLIRVESDYENRAKRGVIVSADDETETALDNYKNWDVVVENNGSYEELVERAKEVVVSVLTNGGI